MTSTYQGVLHSTLVQRHIRSAMDCYEEFADYGSDGRTIPVVLKPGRYVSLCSCHCPINVMLCHIHATYLYILFFVFVELEAAMDWIV